VPYFRRLCGYDFPTAYYAALPGGLQDMVVFGEEAGGNVRALSLIHATRVLVIVVALPFLLKGIWDADLDRPPGVPLTTIAPSELALMVLAAGFGWWAARKVGLFGATILGPMILAAVVTLAGLLEQRPPAEAIGMTIGSNYNGITVNEIRKDILAGLGFCGLLIILTVAFVEAIYSFGLAPGMSALLAYSPGGQAELTVLALVVGADIAFVVAHHLLRLVIVIMGAPLAARLLDRGRG
ncbi:MAG: AbrB family transcriptional regulator, partial [Boseongicola sp. SB0673_bin_14]|nr:AbrB family transcriptional regulator [Boseongicola sp. SB0673_bin_14]